MSWGSTMQAYAILSLSEREGVISRIEQCLVSADGTALEAALLS